MHLSIITINRNNAASLEKQWWNGTEEELKKVERNFWDVETFLKENKEYFVILCSSTR